MNRSTQAVDLRPDGLSEQCHPRIHALGHRGSRIIYAADPAAVQLCRDETSGLLLFPLDEVFLDHTSILLGFGTPNTFTAVYRDDDDPKGPGWNKFAAFMFWRQAAYVADTKGRVQAGVFFELRGLAPEVRASVRYRMATLAGRRGPSCARHNAEVLARAGFRLGNGQSLRRIVRPSKFASLLWRYGLQHNGQAVDIRIVIVGEKGVGDHFVGVWSKEFTSPCRTVKRTLTRSDTHVPAPTFEPREVGQARGWTGPLINIGMSRPRWLGTKLAFLWGQHPVYTVELPQIDKVPELQDPLISFPGRLDRVTKLKKHILFSRPVITVIRRFRIKTTDRYKGVPASAALDMLTPSQGPDNATAVLYNCVVTLTGDGQTAEARITSLKNQDPRSLRSRWVRIVNWIMAKHVLESGYDPRTVFACELWTYVDTAGKTVVCINNNSGTYKPSVGQLEAIASYLHWLFNAPVRTFPM